MPVTRIGTWNLEGAKATSSRGLNQSALVRSVDADIWAFTEADPESAPYQDFATSALIPGTASVFAMIASRWPLTALEARGVPTAAAALVERPTGAVVVIAVCMPWRPDAPPLPPGSVVEGLPRRAHWAYVLERIDNLIETLADEHPTIPVVLAGDFNQTLIGHVVGSRSGRESFQTVIARHEMAAFTKDLPSATDGCPTIDHIIGPAAWVVESTMHAPTTDSGRILSDHAAYSIRITAGT